MDPYIKVRMGGREFRTQVMTNAGKKAKFHWAQVIDWHGEPDIHFLAMDSNILVADGIIGEAVYKGLPLHSNFEGQSWRHRLCGLVCLGRYKGCGYDRI